MSTPQSLDTECPHCRATGLYRGFAEPAGVAVVCLACSGTGCLPLRFQPFTGRKPAFGVRTVRRSAGSFLLTGVGPAGGAITYAEFARGALPGAATNVSTLPARKRTAR